MILSSVPCTVFAASTTAVTSGTYEDVLVYEIRSDKVWITSCKSSATEVIIPDTIEGYPVTAIGNEAFYYCSKLSKITIPKSIVTIDGSAFYGCEKLLTAGPIGSGSNIEFAWDTAIPNNAFSGCNSLVSVYVPDGIATIGYNAFYGCETLSDINLPDGIISIGEFAFQNTEYFNNESNWSNKENAL